MSTLETAARTHTGKVRDRNEDTVHVDPERGLAVVADGMGGHPAGDRASTLAVDEVVARLGSPPSDAARTEPRPLPSAPRPESEDAPSGRDADMAETVQSANRRILEDGREHPEHRGMGTTLTVLRTNQSGERYQIGHVGDSRAYRFRDGSLEPLTVDHSPLHGKVVAGELTREEARVHPMSHMLSQALGSEAEVEPQILDGEVVPGDVFLLCTDGLVAVLSEREIEEACREGARDLDALAERLVERTLEGGAPDNVTVALLSVSPR